MASIDRVAVIGASGQLGNDLMKAFQDCGAIGLDHRLVDIEEPSSVLQALRKFKPTLVVNTAAYHNVDLCEAFPARAFAVNALAVDTLAGMCASLGIAFAHISTDYVFSGEANEPYGEEDATDPVNVYGCSKRAGEQLMRRHAKEQFVFRTSGLFGTAQSAVKGLNFVERMIRGAANASALRVVDDVTFSPSYTVHVAQAIRTIVESSRFGTYHVTNAGSCSWYDLAEEAIRAAGFEPRVERTNSDPGALPKRPRMSALRHGAMAAAGFKEMPSWRAGVEAYVAARPA